MSKKIITISQTFLLIWTHALYFFFSPQDILFVRHNLSLLNGPIAKMTGLVSVIFAELTILGKFSGPSY